MSEPPSPRRAQMVTTWIIMGSGAFVFLIVFALSCFDLMHKLRLPQTREPVTARVEELSVMCALEKKSGKTWSTVQVAACDQAAAIVAERNSFVTPWRSTPGQYAVLSYMAGGKGYRRLLHVGLLGERPIAVSGDLQMYVEPGDPDDIERPYEPGDTAVFWTTTLVGAAFAIITAFVGWGSGLLVRRRQEAALAKAQR